MFKIVTLILATLVCVSAGADSLPTLPQTSTTVPASDLLRFVSDNYYIVKSSDPASQQFVIEASCVVPSCQFTLELRNTAEFTVVSNEPGDAAQNRNAKITLAWNQVPTPSDVIMTYNAEVAVYTTNFVETFVLVKNFPVFIYP